jgi:hypothetical protein
MVEKSVTEYSQETGAHTLCRQEDRPDRSCGVLALSRVPLSGGNWFSEYFLLRGEFVVLGTGFQ